MDMDFEVDIKDVYIWLCISTWTMAFASRNGLMFCLFSYKVKGRLIRLSSKSQQFILI